ncbi:NAD(P)-binding domain-containing protein, partial [Microvirga tunisiensis]
MRIGIIGLGRMGTALATRLQGCGHDLVVWNRTPEKARGLIEGGAVLERVDIQAFDGLANLIQAPFGRGGLGERSSSDVERSPVGSDGAAFAGQTH